MGLFGLDSMTDRDTRNFDREQFYRDLLPHLASLYNFAHWLTRNRDEAEEIVHDAISSLVTKRNSYSPGTNLRAFLITVIRRVFINRLRRGRYEVTSAGFPEGDEILPTIGNPEGIPPLPEELVRRDINRAVGELSEEFRSIVILSDIEGFSLQEISEIMEIPIGTVKSRLWRARGILREKLMAYKG